MKAGFARRNITPDRSMHMAGFDRRKDPSIGTLDELEVCVLALADQQETPFVMCVFDLLGTDSRLCTHVREAVASRLGIAPERIWVCATHTHSAPPGISPAIKVVMNIMWRFSPVRQHPPPQKLWQICILHQPLMP